MSEVGILVIDDDIASQRALKHILDSEGWRVRILSTATRALDELASGDWRLIIINSALMDLNGPLFTVLKELAQSDPGIVRTLEDRRNQDAAFATEESADVPQHKGIRVLFLVPLLNAQDTQTILEREDLPYTLKPYHLADFLEKVSELLVEAGAIAEPIRSVREFGGTRKRRRKSARDGRSNAMFASRDDYSVSDEEMAEYENEQATERKKREKELNRLKDLGRP